MLDQETAGKAEVALRMIGRHFSLVAPEEMQVLPFDARAPWATGIGQELIEEVGRVAARQRKRCKTAHRNRRFDERGDPLGRCLRHRDLVADDRQSRHWRLSRSISRSASDGPHVPGS